MENVQIGSIVRLNNWVNAKVIARNSQGELVVCETKPSGGRVGDSWTVTADTTVVLVQGPRF